MTKILQYLNIFYGCGIIQLLFVCTAKYNNCTLLLIITVISVMKKIRRGHYVEALC